MRTSEKNLRLRLYFIWTECTIIYLSFKDSTIAPRAALCLKLRPILHQRRDPSVIASPVSCPCGCEDGYNGGSSSEDHFTISR